MLLYESLPWNIQIRDGAKLVLERGKDTFFD